MCVMGCFVHRIIITYYTIWLKLLEKFHYARDALVYTISLSLFHVNIYLPFLFLLFLFSLLCYSNLPKVKVIYAYLFPWNDDSVLMMTLKMKMMITLKMKGCCDVALAVSKLLFLGSLKFLRINGSRRKVISYLMKFTIGKLSDDFIIIA